MKLLLRRDQKSGMIGKPTFSLTVRAAISEEDRAAIKKYKLGDTQLYASHEVSGGSGLLGVMSRAALKAISLHVSVDDLAGGKRVECKDIVEMIAIEEQIKEAARIFVGVLNAAKHFGGEEAIELS